MSSAIEMAPAANNSDASPIAQENDHHVSYFQRFMQQYSALLKKTYLTFKRRWIVTTMLVLIPSLIVFVTWIIARAIDDSERADVYDPLFAYTYWALAPLGTMIYSLSFMMMIVAEKNGKVLAFVRNTGLLESTFWLSWFTMDALICFAASFLACILGISCNLDFFVNTDFLVLFFIHFLFLLSSVAFAFVFASCMSKSSYIYAVIGLGLILYITTASILASLGLWMGTWPLLLQSSSAFVQLYSFIFPFNYFLYNINQVIRVSQDIRQFSWPPAQEGIAIGKNRHFSFEDITERFNIMDWQCQITYSDQWYEQYQGNYTYTNSTYIGSQFVYDESDWDYDCMKTDTNTVLSVMGLQVLQILVFLLLTWYLAQTIGGGGGDKKFTFLFDKRYWGFREVNKLFLASDTLANEKAMSQTDGSIRCAKVSKSFDKVTAVKEVSMEIAPGKITAILGPNGAGKSTLVGVLTGMYAPTHGHAFVQGLDVMDDIQAIHQRVGICYQHNPLWDHLTAREHLDVICTFRGLPSNERHQAVEDALKLFRLDKVKVPTQGYSGGMKRRLLIAMSIVGSPDVVLLDEPTTGMDPLNRRYTWNALQSLKSKMLILLVTHSMEEADYLCDDISIMINGRLRAKGTSMFLKEKYGIGYQLKFSLDPRYVMPVMDVVKNHLPASQFPSSISTAGELLVAVPKKDKDLLPDFFRWLEKHQELSEERGVKIIKEWGISNSTLEDVFIRFTQANTGINAEVFSEGNGPETKRCQLCILRDADTVKMFTVNNEHGRAVLVENHVCNTCWNEDNRRGDEKSITSVATPNQVTVNEDSKEGKQPESPHQVPQSVEPAPVVMASLTPQGYDLRDPLFLFNLPVAPLEDQQAPVPAQGNVIQGDGVAINVRAENDSKDDVSHAAVDAKELKPVSFFEQVRAIFLHDLYLLVRQKKANIGRAVFLVIIALVLSFAGANSKRTLYISINASVIVACLFWSTLSTVIATDRRTTVLHTLTISGARLIPYTMGHFLFYFVITFIWSSCIPLVLLMFVSGAGPNIGEWIGVNLVWSFSICSMAIFQGAIVSSNVGNISLAYILIVVNSAVSGVTASIEEMPMIAGIFPPFAYSRALQIVLGRFGNDPRFNCKQCENVEVLTLEWSIGWMIIVGVSSLLLGVLIIMIRQLGLQRSYDLLELWLGIEKSDAAVHLDGGHQVLVNNVEDEDVRNERTRVEDASFKTNEKSGMCVSKLTKVYPGGKTAVDNMSMAIDYGQTFALLGPNGAGKSTAISILSGLLTASYGDVHIGGYDMLRQSELLYRLLGVCPQHDVVYDDATVREHLLLYGRIKGVPIAEEESRARNIAELVELDGDAFEKIAKTLSGGQRRRLSIGISLVGDPRVWMLDEPTTGLDPDVRRVVWEIIQKKKSRTRATLITSHAMDEAEILCDHIGIMSQGRLKCIGTPLHLKHRFGSGMQLHITMKKAGDSDSKRDNFAEQKSSPDEADDDTHAYMDEFIRNNISQKVERTYLMGPTRRYRLPVEGVKVSQVFQVLEAHREDLDLRDWAVNHSSLEEVFVNIVQDDETTGA